MRAHIVCVCDLKCHCVALESSVSVVSWTFNISSLRSHTHRHTHRHTHTYRVLPKDEPHASWTGLLINQTKSFLLKCAATVDVLVCLCFSGFFCSGSAAVQISSLWVKVVMTPCVCAFPCASCVCTTKLHCVISQTKVHAERAALWFEAACSRLCSEAFSQ